MPENKTPEIRFKEYAHEWQTIKFDKAFTNIPNNTLSRAELNYDSGLAKNIHYGDVLINFGEVLDISKEKIPFVSNDNIVNKLKASNLQDGDIVIADAAEDETVGKCTELVYVGDDTVLSGLHTIPVRPTQEFASKYLGYYMNSPAYHNQLLRLMQGTKVLSISKTAIKDTSILYPVDANEQSQIGNYFQSIDNLISLHQKKHNKLTIFKKAMLEKMFPKAGADKPEIRFMGFERAWVRKKLGDLSDSFEYGLNAAATKYDGINKYIRITDINEDTNAFDSYDLTSPNTNLDLAENYKLELGDILFARTGASVGKTYIYKEADGLVYYAGFLIRARIKPEIDTEFIFQSTLTEAYKKFIKLTSQRSGQPGVNAQEYSDYTLLIPTIDEQNKIGKYFRNLDNLITIHQKELAKLRNIKTACLEKMFV